MKDIFEVKDTFRADDLGLTSLSSRNWLRKQKGMHLVVEIRRQLIGPLYSVECLCETM